MKYKLTDECIEFNGVTLFRIQALKTFSFVNEGDLGGFVESEENLSQDYTCWVGGNAKVYGNARVYGNALVLENAVVCDNAKIFHSATICNNAKVYDNASIEEYALVCDTAVIRGNTRLYGKSKIYGNSLVISGEVEIPKRKPQRRKKKEKPRIDAREVLPGVYDL